MKRIKLLIFIIAIILMIFISTFFIPLKFTIKSVDVINRSEYYLVYRVPTSSTDSGTWICFGDNNGMYENTVQVYMTGNLPEESISSKISDTFVKYIIYGSPIAQKNSKSNQKTINCDDWDFFGYIHRYGYFYVAIDFRDYITIYDLKWADFIDFL